MKLQIGIDGKTYEVDVEVLEDDTAVFERGYVPPHPLFPTTVPSGPVPSLSKPPAKPDAAVDEAKVCRSPVAGVVLRVNVTPGQQLQPNDLMIVLEAMKMETNVTAPAAGKVRSVSIQPGDAVKVNQVLVEFQ
ncbi:MAG TPA: biotin/lipoyl-containing protein [Terriglobales bacterium]|nr:biotin/lipoyl-containing protein [Terriglobales bacterium]